ncbi:MAG: methyltransferase [Proteobacteria bacterium]|nr:methyltransferase [Pseudomonadota bacterium]
MCLGIPMQVIEANGFNALCEGRGRRETVSLLLVGDVAPGQWLHTALGTAREVLDAEQAAQINAGLDALEAAATGSTDFDCHFADLVGREPALPAGLIQEQDPDGAARQ